MPPPTKTHHRQNLSITTHHHPPLAKIYPPPPTTSQNISTTTHHPKNGPPSSKSQNIFKYFNSLFFYEMQYFSPWRRFCVIKFWSVCFSNAKFLLHFTVFKGTLSADLKICLKVCVHMKIIPWKFRIFNPKNSRVICP